MFLTEQLAEFAIARQPLPHSLRQACIRTILDLLTAAIAGHATSGAAAARVGAKRSWGAGPSSCWFTDTRLTPPGAAFANSAAASILDLDDGHRAAAGHPGAAIIPAVFAECDRASWDTETLLHAIAVGYEIGIRVSAARDFKALPTMATGLWCGQGVAGAVGALRDLTAHQIAHAISISGTIAPVLASVSYTEFMGNSIKEAIPFATANGINAVDLAEAHYSGPLDLLDHSDFDRTILTEDLGKSWAIEGVYFKEYSCCRWAHAPIDAMIIAMQKHGLSAAEIERVDVDTFGRALTLNNEVAPTSLESAQYSLPFCIGLAAVRGSKALLPMLDNALGDVDALGLSQRIRLHLDPEFDAMFSAFVPGRVTVTARGQRFSETVLVPKGEPANPMSWADLERKFRAATEGVIDDRFAEAVIESVRSLERGDCSELAAILKHPLNFRSSPEKLALSTS